MNLKKALSILLAIVMVFCTGVVAFGATSETFTEDIFTYELTGGSAQIVRCDASAEGKVVVPAMTQNGYIITSINSEAFENCSKITEIEIGENVRNIHYNPTPDCSSLKRFSVSEKNIIYIADGGVLYSSDLKRIVAYPGANPMERYIIPDGVTRIDAVFDSCSNLKTLTIPESVEYRSFCDFNNCPVLTDIYFGGLENEWLYMDGSAWKTEENNIEVHYSRMGFTDYMNHFFSNIGIASIWGFYAILFIPALPAVLVVELVNWIKSMF